VEGEVRFVDLIFPPTNDARASYWYFAQTPKRILLAYAGGWSVIIFVDVSLAGRPGSWFLQVVARQTSPGTVWAFCPVGSIGSTQILGARSPGRLNFVVAPNVCGSSAWNFPNVTFLVPRILSWLLEFWKIVHPMVEYLGTFLGIRWSGREDYYTFPWCRGDSYLALEEHLVLTVLSQLAVDHCNNLSYFAHCIAPYRHPAIRLRGGVPR
jgi:hypothetical protein